MNKELKTVIFLNYFSIVLSLFSSVLITQVLRYNMGLTHFGLYSLVVTTGSYLLVNEFGIGNAIISGVSKKRLSKDKKDLEGFLFSGLSVYVVLSLTVFLLYSLVAFNSRYIFAGVPDNLVGEFNNMFLVMAANMFGLFFLNYFFSIVTGFEKYVFARCTLIIKLILRSAAIIYLMINDFAPIWVFVTDLVLTFASIVAFAVYVSINIKVRARFHKGCGKTMHELSGRIIYIYFTLILDNVYWNASGTFIGMTGPTEDVGKFLVTITFCLLFIQLSGTIIGYFLPKASMLVADNAGNDALNELMIKVARGLNILMCLVILCFAFLGKEIVEMWIGNDFSISYTLTLIMICALHYPQIQSMGETVLQAQNRYGFRTALYFVSTIVCVSVSWIAVSALGISMSWLGITLSIVIFRIIVMNIYYHKIGLDMIRFFKDTMLKMLAVLAICAFCGWLVSLAGGGGLGVLSLKAFIIVLVYIPAVWFIYLKKDEKFAINKFVKSIFHITF